MATNLIVKGIAALQVFGGASAVTLVSISARNFASSPMEFAIVIILVCISLFAFFSGLLLVQGSEAGYHLTMLVLAIQVPVLHSAIAIYEFVYGFGLVLAYHTPQPDVALDARWIASTKLYFSSGVESTQIGINVIAATALAYLWRGRNLGQTTESDRSEGRTSQSN